MFNIFKRAIDYESRKPMKDYKEKYKEDLQRKMMKYVDFTDLVDNIKNIVPDTSNVEVTSFEYSIEDVTEAILDNDIRAMREISNYFYRASGLYKRLITYYATLHKNYWILSPIKATNKVSKNGKEDKKYYDIMNYVRKFRLSDTIPDILEKIFVEGCCYAYLIEGEYSNSWQILPSSYCRSKYRQDNIPVVEFNINYFDDKYRDDDERMFALKHYPKEFLPYYNKAKKGLIPSSGSNEIWCPLNMQLCTRFGLFDNERPIFFSMIKEIIRLDKNKALDDKQAEQLLFKLLVQKMPLDKNGDMIFDIAEVKDMHRLAASMLANSPGVDILTTWAQIDMLNLDTGQQRKGAADGGLLDTFAETGTSPMIFATEGNLSLNHSVKKDAAMINKILASFSTFLNKRIIILFNTKNIIYNFRFIDVNQFNEEDMMAKYKDLATLGYSKLLPAIAEGQDQAEFVGILDLENSMLQLHVNMIPLQSSHTQSEDKNGRPVLSDDKKEDTTIQNITGNG